LWSLDALGDHPITLLLSSRGGTVGAALALIDVLDVVGVEVRATCLGAVEGPSIAVLSGCDRRRAAPNTRFVLRDEQTSIEGSFRNLEQTAHRLQDERRQLLDRLARATRGRHSLGDLLTDFERGLSLGAEEALAYGLVDEVLPDSDRVVALARTIGFRRPPR
jgi:ATP-dependent Clp protease, protease subunit